MKNWYGRTGQRIRRGWRETTGRDEGWGTICAGLMGTTGETDRERRRGTNPERCKFQTEKRPPFLVEDMKGGVGGIFSTHVKNGAKQ